MIQTACSAAHLELPQSGSLAHCSFERIFLEKQPFIERWFRQQWQNTPAVITSSVDLRNEGFRMAPIDTNLFPAGFNNLNPTFFPLAIQAAQSVITEKMPGCSRILIIPENHTRNTFYFQSLLNLYNIFLKAGFEMRLGSLLPDLKEPLPIPNSTLYLEPVIRKDNRLQLSHFNPCMILLNNDLSDGIPEIFEGITQPIYPTPELGWSKRFKSNHFKHYRTVAEEFSELVSIDPWQISPLFRVCSDVNFMDGTGISKLADIVDGLFIEIRKKYEQYSVKNEPFIVVKADAGTYGMGILIVKNADEIRELNRKQRTKMSTTKGNQKITQVIVQEGIYTFETAGTPASVAEPVIYMLGQYAIGGFYRVHKEKKQDENLNMPGMHFEPLAFNAACNNPQSSDKDMTSGTCSNRFYTYSVIARLASLAAARESAEACK